MGGNQGGKSGGKGEEKREKIEEDTHLPFPNFHSTGMMIFLMTLVTGTST